MKTYKQFIFDSYNALKDRENIQELVPLLAAPAIAGGLKIAGKAYLAYQAYQAAQKLRKGDYQGAALDAALAIPSAGVAGKLGQALKLGQRGTNIAKNTIRGAKVAGITADALRDENPTTTTSSSNNANSIGQRGPNGGMTDAQIKAAQDKANADRRSGKMSDLRGGGGNVSKPKTSFDPKKLPGAGIAIRTDLSSPTMRTKAEAEAEQGIEKDKPASTNANTAAAQADAQSKERRDAEAKKKAEQALKKKNQELNDKLRPDFAMAG